MALIELGFAYVAGYKPLANYQQLLFDVVAETLLRPAPPASVLSAMVAPPRPAERNVARSPIAHYKTVSAWTTWPWRHATGLLAAGEHFVAEFERSRLRSLGKPKLAERIEVVSDTRGDGAGFDVLSFEKSGKERFIEVKTTGFGKETPFFVTRNELSFSIDHTADFQLYRLVPETEAAA